MVYERQTRLIEPIYNYHKEKIMLYARGDQKIVSQLQNFWDLLGWV